ncbi:MAG: polymer-forming cytoskeletal protein [Betaproteobacteria bacterium]
MQAKTHQLQKGFTLLELSMTTVITTMIIIGTIQMQTYQATLDAARSIGDMYRHVGKAAESYMANYYGRIRGLPDACSDVGWAGSTVLNRPAGPPAVGCAIRIAPPAGQQREVVIANGLQPTLEELEQLGLMVRAGGVAFNNQLPIPTFAGLNRNPLQITDAAGNAAPAQYAVLIRRMPLAGGGLAADLSSLVFNLQPYNLTNTSRSSDILLDQIVMAAGGDAFLSDNRPGTGGQLRGQNGADAAGLPNPLQVNLNGVVQGAPFVLAMRGGFGSSGFDQFVRRDGTQTLTSAWNVGGQDITGVGTLQAATVSAATGTFAGDLSAGGNLAVTGNGIYSGNLSAGGNLAVTGNGAFAGDLSARDLSARKGTFAGDLDVTGLGNFRGNVDVAGNITGQNGTFRGDVKADGDGTFKGNLSANDGTFKGALKAASAKLDGFLEAASAKIAGLLEAGSAKITGLLEAGSAYISGAFEVAGNAILGSLQVRGATNLFGTLDVDGTSTFKGNSFFKGSSTFQGSALFQDKTTVNQLMLASEGEFGKSCDPANETIRRASLPNTPNSVRLVVCDPNTRTWTYTVDFTGALNTLGTTLQTNITTLGSNLQANIDTLQSQVAKGDKDLLALVEKNTSDIATNTKDIAANTKDIGSLDNRVTVIEKTLTGYTDLQTLVNSMSQNLGTYSIANINNTLSQLGVTVGGLGTDVSTLKGQQIKWELINFQWDKGDPVWKKTPWGCNGLGGATYPLEAPNTTYYPNASVVQASRGNYTTPIMVGFDQIPLNDKTVYDFNCIGGYWYIGMSSVKANTDGGNNCRQGLAKQSIGCQRIPDSSYVGLPGYNTEVMAARFIALSRGSL